MAENFKKVHPIFHNKNISSFGTINSQKSSPPRSVSIIQLNTQSSSIEAPLYHNDTQPTYSTVGIYFVWEETPPNRRIDRKLISATLYGMSALGGGGGGGEGGGKPALNKYGGEILRASNQGSLGLIRGGGGGLVD